MVDSQNKLLNRRILREFKDNFRQYISIILIAALSVALFSGLISNYYHFDENLDSLYEESNIADLFLTVNSCTDEDYNELKNNPIYGINEIEKRIYSDAYINEKKIYLVATNDNTISTPAEIVSGRALSIDDSDEILISESFAKRRNVKVGSMVTVNLKIAFKDIFNIDEKYYDLFSSILADGKENILLSSEINIQFRVCGIMTHGESVGNLASSSGVMYTRESSLKYVVKKLMNETYDFSKISDPINRIFYSNLSSSAIDNANLDNQFVIKGGSIDKIKAYFLAKENNNMKLLCDRSLMPGNQSVEVDVKQALKLCYVFPVIFYLVAVLIIITSLSNQISKDKINIGILMSLGINRRKIILYYAKTAIFLISIGGILGLIIGPNLVPYVMSIKYSILYNLHDVAHPFIYPIYLLFFIVMFVLAIFISIILCNKILKVSPKDVLRGEINKPFNGLFIEKKIKAFNKLSAYTKMTIRNIRRNISRSIMVIVGIMGCSALLICGFGIDNTLDYGISLELGEKVSYDVTYIFRNGETNKETLMASIPEIIDIEEYQYSVIMAEYNGALADTVVNVIEPNSKGYNIECDNEGITISKKIANEIGASKGDFINIYYSNNLYSMKISNVVDMFMSQGLYISKEICPFEIHNNRGFVYVSDNENFDLIKNKIEQESGIVSAMTVNDYKISADDTLSSVRLITLTIKTFAILLAIVVVYNLAMLNFKERVRGIATLKVLGYGYKDVSRALLYEILLLTIIGSIAGMAFGYPLLYGVMSINEPTQISYIYKINISTYFYSFLITFGVSFLINLLVSFKTNGVKMVESLKSVE